MLTLERYPTADLLKLLANILSHIAQSNDRNPPVSIAAIAPSPTSSFSLTSAARTVLVPTTGSYSTTNAPLTFHARNVPTISLESYLLRILKYCPTSNFVFLSLLVYFDRMAALALASGGVASAGGRRVFHVDSYNVHRLVIAGITVASKFFSDVFYTNSRYAKVGGLPLPELNQLELQFLLLNDFRLVISPQQMLLYSQHLITFSLEHPPPSMGPIGISVLAATLGFNPPSTFPLPPPPPLLVSLPSNTTPIMATAIPTPSSSSSSSPHVPPSSPPLRPSASPSPSPSNSSSSSPSSSPRPPRMRMTNGHPAHPHPHPRHSHLLDPRDHNDDTDSDDDSDKGDAEETETHTSTSTDDDSEPTIRGPSTVVGWEGDGGRKSP